MVRTKGWKIVLLLWWLCRVTQPANVEDAIETCLFKLLKKYFLKQPVLLVTDLTIDREPFRRRLTPNLEKEYHLQIVGKIMAKRKWTLQVYNTDRYMGLPGRLKLDRLRNCFFFVRSEVMASKALFDFEMDRLKQNPLWNPVGRTIVVVKAERSANDSSADLARRIIKKMWTNSKSVDNVVMVAEESGDIQFFTWFPYRQPECARVETVVHLDTFRGRRFLRGIHLFPRKLQDDLEGCEVVAASDACIPYVFADANNASSFVDGLEVHIMRALARMMNFKLVTVRPRNMWTTSINGSLTGAFKLLVEQKVDMAFSCLMLNRERYLLAPALPSYFEDSLVWFVPSPSFGSHVNDIFYTFPLDFWLLMVAVMASAIVLVILPFAYLEHGGRDWVGYVLRLVGLSMYAPVSFPTKKNNLRIFVFLFCLYSMHITIAFQSSLFALYRHTQYSSVYSSLKRAVDAGLFVYLRSSSEEQYNQTDHALWNKILAPGRYDYLQDFSEAFGRIAYEKTAVALYIKTTGIYMISEYFTDEYGGPQILWVKQEFSPYPVTTYLSPGNPFYSVFEISVHRLIDSGLIRIWLDRSIQAGTLHFEGGGYANRSLTMAHLGGAFFLLLLLLFAGVLVFLGEVLTHWVWRRTKGRSKPEHRRFFVPVKPKVEVVTIARVGREKAGYF